MRTLNEIGQIVKTSLVVGLVGAGGLFTGLIYAGLNVPISPLVPEQTVDLVTKSVSLPEAKPRYVMDLPVTDASRRRIFHAVCLWEHRGVIRPDDVHPTENSHGPAQIRQIYLDDANEYAGTNYTLQDCHDYEVSYKVVCAYWARYNMLTDQDRARGHNGGPKGPKRSCTLEYWRGVQTYL